MKRMLLAGVFAAAACGSAQAETTLTLVEVITSPQRTELLQGMVDKFEAANPDVSVEIISLPWGQAFEKLATMVQGGQAIDVVEMPERWMSLYAGNGQLESLEPYLAAWDGTGEINDTAMGFGRVVGDTAYMIPYGFYLRALFYNKTLFAAAGLDGPPETWDEFKADAAAISALGDGKYGYCLRGGPGGTTGWLLAMTAMEGSGRWFDDDGRSIFYSDAAKAGAQLLVDVYTSGGAPRDSVNWGFNEIVAGFYSGTCAMLDQDPDALIAVSEYMNAEDFAVAPLPLGPGGKAYPSIGYAGWAMFASSEHKDDAFALISHLSSRDSNLEWAKFVGVIPIHKGAEQDPFFQTEQFAGWFTEMNDPRWQPLPYPAHLEEYAYFADVLSIQTGQEMLLGQRTVDDVVTEWADYLTAAQQKWLAEQ
ncbi:MAG: sugar ABC transporter substrate-binding protein [Alphaproteobacteria bacterium]